ncbi:MAG TPA: hypothetical protein VEJ63_11995 [Planctomycetota bacterium]|nr:hypothetical protein [Planctomycetota bacterium]
MHFTDRPEGGHYPPVAHFLGRQTMHCIHTADIVESYIIKADRHCHGAPLSGRTILVKGPLLTTAQIALLKTYLLLPEAYYNGHPRFRRFPSVPNFAFVLRRETLFLDVLLDLHNPGWEFHCGTERYSSWNWVGHELVALAKELFPNFASPRPQSIWRRDAFKSPKLRTGVRFRQT